MGKDETPDNLIHIDFKQRVAQHGQQSQVYRARQSSSEVDPTTGLFDFLEVSRLFGIQVERLRYWHRSGVCPASCKIGKKLYFRFQDLINVRTAKDLLEGGVSLQAVRRSIEALRDELPAETHPLSQTRIWADAKRVVVQDDKGIYEPGTGQALIDFRVEALRADVVRLLRPEPTKEQRMLAYEYYLKGCELDEQEETYAHAERAYQCALAHDPALACAHTNLGNLRYRQGRVEEATRHYHDALALNASQPEALYNLGYLCVERAEYRQAIEYLQLALDADPGFADAHSSLATAYDALDLCEDAKAHWEAYLALEPKGRWSERAEERLRG